MPHVELALTYLAPVLPERAADPLAVWVDAAALATEPCLVIDRHERVVAMSASCMGLLGLRTAPVGRPLRGGALRLIDFSSPGNALIASEVDKIPPLLALSSGRLARGLIRVECARELCTLDAIATPIGETGTAIGSLTFFSPV
jgi:hypothetical protein